MSEKFEPEFAPSLLGKTMLSPHDDQFAADFPSLYELLMPKFKGKRCSREAGSLSIKVDGSMFRLTLVCPTEEVQATLETPSLTDLFEQVETWLHLPIVPWVPTWEAKKNAKKLLDKSKPKADK